MPILGSLSVTEYREDEKVEDHEAEETLFLASKRF